MSHFAPHDARVGCGSTMLRHSPSVTGEVESELLHGELLSVTGYLGEWALAETRFGEWPYKGFVKAVDLTSAVYEPTHKVAVRSSPIVSFPGIKAAALMQLSYGALVAVVEEKDHHVRLWPEGWMFKAHLEDIDQRHPDYVATIEGLAGVPFLWGGRSHAGVDCSGMIEVGLRAAGIPCARRMVHLAKTLGTPLAEGSAPARGDFFFYSGHCGMFVSESEVINSNAMVGRVQVERYAVLQERMVIRKYEFQSIRRLDDHLRA